MEIVNKPTAKEAKIVIKAVSKYIDLTVTEVGNKTRTFVKIDKRCPMYGGNGIVYLLQMFDKEKLINNRIGAHMVFLHKHNSSGFHTHGPRNEQEIYVVLYGEGEYLDKVSKNGKVRKKIIKKGSITTVKKNGFHSVKNLTNKPLIIFVITTNAPTK